MFAAPYNARKSLAQKCLITTLIRLKYLNFRAKDTQNWICKRVIQVKKSRIFNLIFSAKIQIFRLFYLLEVQIFSVKISNIWVGKLLTKTNFGILEDGALPLFSWGKCWKKWISRYWKLARAQPTLAVKCWKTRLKAVIM